MAESTELFDLKNYFFIGNYQGAVNEGMSINAKTLGEQDKISREVYIYRSYIAQGNHKFVLNEISESSNTSLRAVKLLASYYATENKDTILNTLKEWLNDSAASNNTTLQVIGATIYYLEDNLEESLRCVYHNNTLEGLGRFFIGILIY
jgi:coatomer protein complex subunit epsilon